VKAGWSVEDQNVEPDGGFIEIPHTADRAITVRAATLPGLFATAAGGMFSLMADLDRLHPRCSRSVGVEALDLEMLLVEWLNELLFLREVHEEIYCRFEVSDLQPGSLEAVVWGEPGLPTKAGIKAATYHDLEIRQESEFWQATIVFDV